MMQRLSFECITLACWWESCITIYRVRAAVICSWSIVGTQLKFVVEAQSVSIYRLKLPSSKTILAEWNFPWKVRRLECWDKYLTVFLSGTDQEEPARTHKSSHYNHIAIRLRRPRSPSLGQCWWYVALLYCRIYLIAVFWIGLNYWISYHHCQIHLSLYPCINIAA